MNKRILFLLLAAIPLPFSAQSNWFKAQTDKAVVKSVTATSELVEGQYDGRYLYPPINILDGDLSTTWCEADEDGPGIGESITVEFAGPVSFDELQIVNGFASGNNYYLKNNRVKSMQLTQVAGKHYQQKEYTLNDNTPDWQSIKFDLLQTAQTITIKITDIYKGNKYDDTCLDDIRLLYKGTVIPFENIAELKTAQEENSKQMLKTSAADFKNQFKSLLKKDADGNYEPLFLISKNQKDAICIDFQMSRDDSDPEINTIEDITVNKSVPISQIPALAKKNGYSDGSGSPWIGNGDLSENTWFAHYKQSDYDWIVFRFFDWERADYSLGNCRIIKTENIDYVEVSTVTLIKLAGKDGLYLNGVFYTIADSDRVLDCWYSEY